METIEEECRKCKSVQKHTFRVYETKVYSFLPTKTERHVTLVCHGCLLESKIPKEQEKDLLKKYEKQILTADGHRFFEKGKYKEALNMYDQALKKDPEFAGAIYGKARTLIAKQDYRGAEKYVETLMSRFPKDRDVNDMNDVLRKYLPSTKNDRIKDHLPKEMENETPLEILKLRYSKGEITREEYLQMKKDLE
ncbi:MAG: tetratricopeptide repeat protein [Thaumarchaeota archaeon]|nr:tetratricopeptide repeat protein [Nitrososphaerota archaeon]